jgi:hypothetical protein
MMPMHFLMLQAFVELIRYDVFLIRHDFAALHSELRLLRVSSRPARPGDLDAICRAISRACIWYFKEVKCLEGAVVYVRLLRRYGIDAQMVFGAQRIPLKAHAWAEFEGRVINDRPEVQAEYLVMERC